MLAPGRGNFVTDLLRDLVQEGLGRGKEHLTWARRDLLGGSRRAAAQGRRSIYCWVELEEAAGSNWARKNGAGQARSGRVEDLGEARIREREVLAREE